MSSALLFAHISSLSILIPLAIGGYGLKALDKDLRFLYITLILSGLADALSLVFIQHNINTWPILNLFYILQFWLLFLLLDFHLHSRILKFIGQVFILLALLNFTYIQKPFQFNTYSSYMGSFFLLTFTIFYLYKLTNNLGVDNILDLPMFWISFGVLMYFGGTLFLFLFNNLLLKYQPANHQMVWILHNILNITKNSFFSLALWKSIKVQS